MSRCATTRRASPSRCRRYRSDGCAGSHSTGDSCHDRGAASSRPTRGPKRKCPAGPVVCDGWKARDRAVEIVREHTDDVEARVTSPAPRRNHAFRCPHGARATTGCRQTGWVSIRSSDTGIRDLFQQQHAPGGRIERKGRPERRGQHVIVPPNSGPVASPPRTTPTPSGLSARPAPFCIRPTNEASSCASCPSPGTRRASDREVQRSRTGTSATEGDVLSL